MLNDSVYLLDGWRRIRHDDKELRLVVCFRGERGPDPDILGGWSLRDRILNYL